SAEANGVIRPVNRTGVVASKKVALNRLPRTRHAWPQPVGSNLHVEQRRPRENRRIAQRRIDCVHQLLIAEARAVHKTSPVPIQPENRSWYVQLIAEIGLAVGRPDLVGV